MISKIRDSDASQNFTTQSPQANGHLTVLKTTWYVVHFFCLRYSELLNKTYVFFLQLLVLLSIVFLFSLLFIVIFRSVGHSVIGCLATLD